MIVKLKEENLEYPDLTPDQPYFVIGIESDDYRILNDYGKRYSYPEALNEVGFFEDYFDGKDEALSRFWHVVNKQLSEAA